MTELMHVPGTTRHRLAVSFSKWHVLCALQLLYFFFCVQNEANADQFQKAFSVVTAIEHDSNPEMIADDADSVSRAILQPEFVAHWRSGPLEIEADLSINIERSSDEDLSENREDPSASVAVARAYQKGELSGSVGYSEASTRVTELEDTGQIFSDSTRSEGSLEAALEHNVSARSQVLLSASYIDVEYDTDFFVDHRTSSAEGTYEYQVDDRVRARMTIGFSRYDPQSSVLFLDEETEDSSRLEAGLSNRFSERLECDLSVGGISFSGADNDSDWVASADCSYRYSRLDITAAYTRDASASGAGRFEIADTYALELNYGLTENTGLSLAAGVRKNQESRLGDSSTFELGSETALSESWSFRTLLAYREIEGSFATEDADGYLANVSVVYRTPRNF